MSKEVFLLVNDEYEGLATDVCVFDTLDELNLQLSSDSFGNTTEEDDLQVFHGRLVSARFIPASFKGSTPYVFIPNPLGRTHIAAATEAHWEKVKGDPEVVALLIAELLKEKTYKFDNHNCYVGIDDVYLFFGYNMQKVLYVPDDHIDDEVVERVTDLAKTLDAHNEKLKEGIYETKSRS